MSRQFSSCSGLVRLRKADDLNRDRHWSRCGLNAIRIPAEYAQNRDDLAALCARSLPATSCNASREESGVERKRSLMPR